MRKSIAVAAIGLGFLFVAGPAHAADGDGTADVSSYALVPTEPVEPAVLSDAPVPAAVVPPAAVAAANGGLPVTGSNSDAILQIGAAALLTGGGLVIVSQKRNRKARQS